eukprot:gene12920-8777_t
MPPTEMQQMEMDMVESMYDTYELVSADPIPTYTVLLAASADDPHELQVTVSYPSAEYPDSAPCSVVAESISAKRRVQTASMNKEVATMLEENVGMHTVIMALQQLQEFLTVFAEEEEKAEVVRRGEAIEAAAVAKSNPIAADPTIRLGMAVTKELFDQWSAKRRAERMKTMLAEAKKEKSAASKLTGRQLWDSTEAADDDEDLDFDTFASNAEEEYDLDDE